MMSQDTVTIMANFDVITFAYIDARSQGLSWHAIYCRKFCTETTATLQLNMQWFKNPRFFAHCAGFLYAEAKNS